MARCKSCEGIIGVDCFNPSECEYIAHLQELEEQDRQFNPQSPSQIYFLEGYIDALEAEKAELLSVLKLMVETYEEGGWPTATIVIAKAAIAKAEGMVKD